MMNDQIFYSKRYESVGRSEGWPCPSTPLMFKCRGHLGEYTIRLGYAFFLTLIDFRRVGNAWGSNSWYQVRPLI